MKGLLLLFVVPFALAIPNDDPAQPLLDQLWSLVEMGSDGLIDLIPQDAPNTKETNNPVYGPLLKIISAALKKPDIAVAAIGNESTSLYVKNGIIKGMENLYLDMQAPNSGYFIDNLTLFIPELDISAEQYTLTNLNLGGLITLNGQGHLHIKLTGIKLYTKMEIKYLFVTHPSGGKGFEFVVKKIPALELAMENSLFELEHLGGTDSLSSLLNGIVNKVLTKLIVSINNEMQTIIVGSEGGDCSKGIDLICSLIGYTITEMKKKLIG